MRKRVRADYRFVRRYLRSGDFGQHAARREKMLELDIRRHAKTFLADGQSDHDFFKRRVACTLADAVDRTFNLTHASANRRKRIRHRHSQIVVAMRAERHALRIAEVLTAARKHRAVFSGKGVYDSVGEVKNRRARLHGDAENFAEKIDVSAARVF